jgi:hypothetical protein
VSSETGGDDGNLNFSLHLWVEDDSEDDVCIWVNCLSDDLSSLVAFEESEVTAAGNVE